MMAPNRTCTLCGFRGPCVLSVAPMRCLCDLCHEALLGDGPVTPLETSPRRDR